MANIDSYTTENELPIDIKDEPIEYQSSIDLNENKQSINTRMANIDSTATENELPIDIKDEPIEYQSSIDLNENKQSINTTMANIDSTATENELPIDIKDEPIDYQSSSTGSVCVVPILITIGSLGFPSREDEVNKKMCDKYAALNTASNEFSTTSLPSGQQHALPDAVQNTNHKVKPTCTFCNDSVCSASKSKESSRLRWALRKDIINKKRREKYAASKLSIASNEISNTSLLSGQQHASPDAVQSTKCTFRSIFPFNSLPDAVQSTEGTFGSICSSSSDSLSAEEISRLRWASRKDVINKKRREKYAASKLSIASNEISNTSPPSGHQQASPGAVQNTTRKFKSISVLNSDNISAVPSAKDVQRLKWASTKDQVNKKRRDKYAASKLSIASNEISNTSLPSEHQHASPGAVQNTKRKFESISTSNSDSISAVPSAKEIQRLKWASTKDQVNKRRREKYAIATSNKHKQKLSDDNSSNEGSVENDGSKKTAAYSKLKELLMDPYYSKKVAENKKSPQKTLT